MAGVTVAREELESDVAATAAVAASRRTNTRNNFFGIHSVLPKDQVERSYQKNSNTRNWTTVAKFQSSDSGFPVLELFCGTSTWIVRFFGWLTAKSGYATHETNLHSQGRLCHTVLSR